MSAENFLDLVTDPGRLEPMVAPPPDPRAGVFWLEPKYPDRLRRMHGLHGEGPKGKRCGDCEHFFAWGGYAGTYYKCRKAKVTNGAKTDWRVRWPACGAWEDRDSGDDAVGDEVPSGRQV